MSCKLCVKYVSCIILFKFYEVSSITVLFLHMRNERYERLMTAAQSPIDRLGSILALEKEVKKKKDVISPSIIRCYNVSFSEWFELYIVKF